MAFIWKDVVGFEGFYRVNNKGDIKSVERDVIRSNGRKYHVVERYMNVYTDKFGYKYTVLSVNGKDFYKKIHRLVAEAFIPNPNNYPYINHKNENKSDNRVENLEWCTAQYNILYSGNYQKAGDVFACPIIAIDKNGNKQKFVSIQSAARELNCDASTICKVLKGKCKTYKGYIFIYGN